MLGSSALRGVNALHGKETKQALDFGQTQQIRARFLAVQACSANMIQVLKWLVEKTVTTWFSVGGTQVDCGAWLMPCNAAGCCFQYSALVHQPQGSQAIEARPNIIPQLN